MGEEIEIQNREDFAQGYSTAMKSVSLYLKLMFIDAYMYISFFRNRCVRLFKTDFLH